MTSDIKIVYQQLLEQSDELPTDFFCPLWHDHGLCTYAENAFIGGLDAAVYLLNELLPAWEWWMLSRHYWDQQEQPVCIIKTGTPGLDLKVHVQGAANPARAMLLCILKELSDD